MAFFTNCFANDLVSVRLVQSEEIGYLQFSEDLHIMIVLIESENDNNELVFGGVHQITHERIVVVVEFVRIEAVIYEMFVEIASKLFHRI